MPRWTLGHLIPRHPAGFFEGFEFVRPRNRDELLDRWSRNFTHRHIPKSNAPRELHVDLVLTASQAAGRGSAAIDVPVARVCDRCDGTGVAGLFDCDACDGHGMRWSNVRVDVLLSPPVRDGTVVQVPLRHVGVDNFYLTVHTRVAGAA